MTTATKTLASLLLLSVCLTGLQAANPVPADCIWVFKDAYFQGAYAEFCGDANTAALDTFNNEISSFILGENIEGVRLVLGSQLQGGSVSFRTHVLDLADHDGGLYDDSVSSIRVYPKTVASGCFYYFAEPNYEGEMVRLCSSWNTLGGIGWNNRMRSFKLGADIEAIKLCDTTFCNTGSSYWRKTFRTDQPTLDSLYDADTSSMNLYASTIPSTCIRMYEDANYLGEIGQWCNDEDNLISEWHNKISSMRGGSSVTGAHLFTSNNFDTSTDNVLHTVPEPSIPAPYNDSINSFKIDVNPVCATCVRIFKENNFHGEYLTFEFTLPDSCQNDERDLSASWDHNVQSIELGSSITTVKLRSENPPDFNLYTVSGNVSDNVEYIEIVC